MKERILLKVNDFPGFVFYKSERSEKPYNVFPEPPKASQTDRKQTWRLGTADC